MNCTRINTKYGEYLFASLLLCCPITLNTQALKLLSSAPQKLGATFEVVFQSTSSERLLVLFFFVSKCNKHYWFCWNCHCIWGFSKTLTTTHTTTIKAAFAQTKKKRAGIYTSAHKVRNVISQLPGDDSQEGCGLLAGVCFYNNNVPLSTLLTPTMFVTLCSGSTGALKTSDSRIVSFFTLKVLPLRFKTRHSEGKVAWGFVTLLLTIMIN